MTTSTAPKDFPKIELSHAKISELRPAEYNPRIMGKEERESLMASIANFGMVDPIIANKDGTVIGGHQRLEAALALGMPTVPTIFLDIPDKKRERALNIALNKIGGKFDQHLLADIMLNDLDEQERRLTGHSDKEIEKMIGKLLKDDDVAGRQDESPEPPKNPETKLGDIIRLGEHVLVCGDSTNEADLKTLLGDERVDMVFTDPPYAIFGSSTGVGANVADDKMVRSFFRDILRACSSSVKEFGHIYVCSDYRSWATWWFVAAELRVLQVKNCIVWDKQTPGMGSMYQNRHEFIMFLANVNEQKLMQSQDKAGHRIVRGDPNIWEIPRDRLKEHNAQKPVELCERAIRNSSDDGQVVLDLFGGSGSTMIACEKIGRSCRMMEIDPSWCDVIIARWENFSGKKAKRETRMPVKG